jgi:pimeloyl-ACP methyl ester carboxylesterase
MIKTKAKSKAEAAVADSKPPENEAYPHTNTQVRKILGEMSKVAKVAQRPVFICCGYHSPRAQGQSLRLLLLKYTSKKSPVFVLSYTTKTSMPAIITSARKQMEKYLPGVLHGEIEFDLVGVSMGGLVARVLAAKEGIECEGGVTPFERPLGVRRIFTLASPHRGALLAEKIRPNSAARDMRPGSRFLKHLDEQLAHRDFELTCYSRIKDGWVGATRSSPPGFGVVWTPGLVWGSHFTVSFDARVLADVCRHLRGEEPLARPSTPPRD